MQLSQAAINDQDFAKLNASHLTWRQIPFPSASPY